MQGESGKGAEAARKEGVSRTSIKLRVEWNELKRRMKAGRVI